MAIIGIDLGTTNSLVSTYQEDKVVYIPNIFGDFITPSAISVSKDGEIFTGKVAKERMITNPEDTAMSFKSFMGTTKEIELGKSKFTAEKMSALLLKQLIEDAQRFLDEEIEEVIISVPAYFDDKQRNATKRAGMLTGIKCERLINEPSAASLAYAHHNKIEESLFMTFDFGGGTLDVTLVDVFENIIEVIGISGDNKLGGKDINEAIASAFLKSNGLCELDQLSSTDRELLLKRSEQCKVMLDSNEQVTLQMMFERVNYDLTFDNNDLMRFCSDIFKKMDKIILRLLRDASRNISEVEEVVLIGGSTKMPLVQEYLEGLTGKKPRLDFEPDYSVVHGLGLAAGIKGRATTIKDYILMDVCPFTLGIGTVEGFSPIIKRNTSLPTKRQNMYVTAYDNQEFINVSIYQGEDVDVKNNLYLDKLDVSVVPALAGKSSITVEFGYDLNGILEVDVISHTLDKSYSKTVIKDQSLSMEEVDFIKSKISVYKDPLQEEATYLFEKCTSDLQELITLATQEQILNWRERLEVIKDKSSYTEQVKLLKELSLELSELVSDSLGLNMWDNHKSKLN